MTYNTLSVQPYHSNAKQGSQFQLLSFGAKLPKKPFTNPIKPASGEKLFNLSKVPFEIADEIEKKAYKAGLSTAAFLAMSLKLDSIKTAPKAVDSKSANVGNSKVTTLIDGEQIFKKQLEDIKNAKESILVEMFEFQNMSVDGNYWAKNGAENTAGAKEQQQLLFEIVKKKEENPDMNIQIILDAHKWYIDGKGNNVRHYANQDMIKFLKSKNIDVVPYPRAAQQGATLNHKKLIVVDDKVAYVGGMNWGTHSAANHDAMVRIERLPNKKNSEVDNLVNEIFIPDLKFSWQRLGETKLIAGPLDKADQANYNGINKEIKEENVEYNRLLKEYFDTPEAKNRYREGKVQSIDVNPIENSKIKILQTRPKEYELIGENGLETTKEYLMDRFNTATKIRSMNFVLTDKELVKTIIKNVQSGKLDAQFIVEPSILDEFPYCENAYDELIENGVDVRIYKTDKQTRQRMHMKCTIFDDKEVVIGSTNLSTQGLTQNLDKGFRNDYTLTVEEINEKIKDSLKQVKQNESKLHIPSLDWANNENAYEDLKTRLSEFRKAYTALKNKGEAEVEVDGVKLKFKKDAHFVTANDTDYEFKKNDDKDAMAELRTIIGYYNIIKKRHNAKPKFKRGNNEMMVAFESPSLAKNFVKQFTLDWNYSKSDYEELKQKVIPIKHLNTEG